MKQTLLTLIYFLFFSSSALAIDISVKSVVLTYNDNMTNKNKPIIRELISLHDNTFWSKPSVVDIKVTIENIGKETVKFINIKPELYHLLSPNLSQVNFPPMENELRTIRKKPTWVWSKNFDSKMIKELSPGQIKTIVFKNKLIRGSYYATDYAFNAFAVRVFAKPRSTDKDYSNNVNQKIINYGS